MAANVRSYGRAILAVLGSVGGVHTAQAVGLGVLQGITEFLPVSSSGHLVLAEHVFGIARPGLSLEVGVHLGTLLAVAIRYRADLARVVRQPQRGIERGLALCVATLPAAAVGWAGGPAVERLFGSLRAVAVAWCVGGLALVAVARRPLGRRRLSGMRLRDALWIGACQALALAPGISRSGATLAAGLASGFEAEQAVRFAFLLSVPAVAGAALLELPSLVALPPTSLAFLGLAAGVAAVTGLWAIRACEGRVRTGGLAGFGYYCIGLGLLCLGWWWLR